MEKDFIQLKKKNLITFGIRDDEGNDTGEVLEFDLEDIELPLKINESDFKHRKNLEWLRNEVKLLEKKQFAKGKDILTEREKEETKILRQFFAKEEEALDLFLGKGGVKKLLNGRGYYYTMYDDLVEVLNPIMPIIKKSANQIKDKIENKYKSTNDGKELK